MLRCSNYQPISPSWAIDRSEHGRKATKQGLPYRRIFGGHLIRINVQDSEVRDTSRVGLNMGAPKGEWTVRREKQPIDERP